MSRDSDNKKGQAVNTRSAKRLSTREAAEYAGYPQQFIRDAANRGDLRSERPRGSGRGRRLYFTEADIDAWLEAIATKE